MQTMLWRISVRIKPNLGHGEFLLDLLLEDENEAKRVINTKIVDKAFGEYLLESQIPRRGFYEHTEPIEINDCSGRVEEVMKKMKVDKGKLVIAYYVKPYER